MIRRPRTEDPGGKKTLQGRSVLRLGPRNDGFGRTPSQMLYIFIFILYYIILYYIILYYVTPGFLTPKMTS